MYKSKNSFKILVIILSFLILSCKSDTSIKIWESGHWKKTPEFWKTDASRFNVLLQSAGVKCIYVKKPFILGSAGGVYRNQIFISFHTWEIGSPGKLTRVILHEAGHIYYKHTKLSIENEIMAEEWATNSYVKYDLSCPIHFGDILSIVVGLSPPDENNLFFDLATSTYKWSTNDVDEICEWKQRAQNIIIHQQQIELSKL